MLISFHLVEFNYAEIHKHEAPFMGHKVLEFLCASVCRVYPDVFQTFQVASTNNTNVKCEI